MKTFNCVRRATALPTLTLAAAATVMPVGKVRADNLLAPVWTGAYIGVHTGAQWADIDTDFSSTFSATDPTGGGHAGFNFGFGGVVIGVEADADLDSAEFGFSTAGGGTRIVSTDWSGTLRGRVGIPLGPALFYATAGYAWRNASLNETTGGGLTLNEDLTFQGVVYGAGLEARLLPNLSLRVEALRYDYGSEELSVSGAFGAAQDYDASDTVVRAGMSFHLN